MKTYCAEHYRATPPYRAARSSVYAPKKEKKKTASQHSTRQYQPLENDDDDDKNNGFIWRACVWAAKLQYFKCYFLIFTAFAYSFIGVTLSDATTTTHHHHHAI